jgi:Cytochrome c554 and c-prime
VKFRPLHVAIALAALAVLALVLWRAGVFRGTAEPAVTEPTASLPAPAGDTLSGGYVGSPACGKCHAAEFEAWSGSQHAVAMQAADEKTVLGDFNDAKFRHFDRTTTFSRRDGKFIVRTDGPDGKPADFEVLHTFGVYPLQQYLIDIGRGHVQALTIAWDARPKADGGQRWFHLYPTERISHEDELHWTNRQQNWNFMCSDCHSTDLQKDYDAASDTFATRWSEISVGCEASMGQVLRT